MSKENEVRVASKLGDMCVHIAAVTKELATQMLNYCDERNIRVDSFERKQWNMLIKSSSYLDSLVLTQGREGIERFRSNVRIFSLLMRLILARVDDDDMKLYKWYNYIKSFPTDLPEIQPTGEEEAEAFKHIFNG